MDIYIRHADPWYFPRKALAEEFLNLFEASGTPALTLFSQRRTGKTSFLSNDLQPAALSRGYVPVYIDFWEIMGDATTALLDVLEQALQEIEVPRSRIGKLLKQPVKSISWFDIGVEFGGVSERKKPRHRLMQIRWYLSQLIARTRRPILLMLDEFQQVALDAEGEKLAASLRSSFQQLYPTVRVVFSGSSESRLTEMFRRTRAPLYEFSAHMPFPPLDRDFVRFICERHQASTGNSLDEATLWQAFLKLERQPKALKELVMELIKRASTNVGTAIADYVQRTSSERRKAIDARLEPLKPLDRLILKRIARGEKPTSKTSRGFYAKQLGVDIVHLNSLTRSLKKLVKLDLITHRTDGSYHLTVDDVVDTV